MVRNPLTYPAIAEAQWKSMLADLSGYTPLTTFFSDLSIAECYGEKAIRDTYNKVLVEWKHDIKYITEFVLCLNHKIWMLYEVDEPIARVYDELWKKSVEFVYANYEGEDLSYYFEITD